MAARIVTGGTQLVSLNNLCLETGWDKLKNRREMHRLVYFYKMKNNISPQYLSDLIPDSLNSIHSHNTRNSSIIPPIRTRTSLYTNYFLPATIRSWNLLPERIKSSTSVNSFKSNPPWSIQHMGTAIGIARGRWFWSGRKQVGLHSQAYSICIYLDWTARSI